MKNSTKKTLWMTALLSLTLVFAPALLAKETTLEDQLHSAKQELSVKAALLQHIGWDMLSVDVEVDGDHAILMGETENRGYLEQAKEVALAVDGIDTVENRLELTEAETDEKTTVGEKVDKALDKGEAEVADALLETRVKGALLRELGTNAMKIEVEATEGLVSLEGELKADAYRTIALETAEKCKGVDRVIDLLEANDESMSR